MVTGSVSQGVELLVFRARIAEESIDQSNKSITVEISENMNGKFDVKMSPLSQSVTRGNKTVRIDIYEDGEGGWLLEAVDEFSNSTVWDEPFDTDESALEEALATIEIEGIDALIGPGDRVLH